jgi:hypothetical protein
MAKPPPITNRLRELREQHGGMSQSALGVEDVFGWEA